MISIAKKIFLSSVKLMLAVSVSLVLMSLIPLLQTLLLEDRFHEKTSVGENRQVLAEVVRINRVEQPKPVTERIKNVSSSKARGMGSSSSAGSGGMHFNFVPDLGVEGSGPAISVTKGNFEAVVFEQGQTDEDVVPVYRPIPQYPAAAKDFEVEGDVEIVFIVNTDGKVESVSIVKMPHSSFEAEVRKTVATWRFKPAKNKGIPVKLRVRQVIHFSMED